MSSLSPADSEADLPREQSPAIEKEGQIKEKASLFRGKLRFWLTIIPLVALDLWSKSAVFAFLATSDPERYRIHPVWDGPVHFHLVAWWNTGTIWGLFQDWTLPLTVLRCLALGLLMYFAARTSRAARMQLHVLGLIFAGALGNLYDNLTQVDGGVRDFLLFFIVREGERTRFPAFNVADSCITVGAVALIFMLWRSERAEKAARE